MSEAAEREKTQPPDGESGPQNNEAPEETPQPPPPALPETTPAVDDLFLGAGVCQTYPQSFQSPLTLPDYVPFSTLQDRSPTTPNAAHVTPSPPSQDIPLDLPLRQPVAASESAWVEAPAWRREDGSVQPITSGSPFIYPRPSRAPAAARFPLQSPSVAGSGILNSMAPGVHQGMGLDGSRSVRPCSVCTSQGVQRGSLSRREEILRLSQNPWGPNTVFGPRSIPTDMHSWQLPNAEHSYEPDCNFHQDGTLPYHLMRQNEAAFSMYSKYRGRQGVVRRVRRKIVDVGGKLCQSFLVWVLFVAALAGLEGFKDKTETLKDTLSDVEWSDSEAESENEPRPRFDVFSFQG